MAADIGRLATHVKVPAVVTAVFETLAYNLMSLINND